MNRRGFLRSLFASTATIVVAPAYVLDELPPLDGVPKRTYFDMGRTVRTDAEIESMLRTVGSLVLACSVGWDLWSANDGMRRNPSWIGEIP